MPVEKKICNENVIFREKVLFRWNLDGTFALKTRNPKNGNA